MLWHCLSDVYFRNERYSRSLNNNKTNVTLNPSKRQTMYVISATAASVLIGWDKRADIKRLDESSPNSDLDSSSVFFLASLTRQQRGVSTDTRTYWGCAPVAGQHVGKRLSAPWGRPASCLWSPPLAADGNGSSLLGGQTQLSGSVS